MKNKHLVLLFAGTLLLGLLLRYFHCNKTATPEIDLLRLDTAAVDALTVHIPGKPEVVWTKTERGWIISENETSIALPVSLLGPLFAALSPLQPLRIISGKNPDTLGLTPSMGILVEITAGNRRETMLVGRVTLHEGQAATYIEMPLHEGRYLVAGNLPACLNIDLNGLWPDNWCSFSPADVVSVGIKTSDRAYRHWIYSDSLQRWSCADTLHTDSAAMASWLTLLSGVRKAGPANFFRENQLRDHRVASFDVDLDEEVLSLRLYYLSGPTMPEDISGLGQKPRPQACYLIHSSRQPGLWYALYDTVLMNRILQTFPVKPYAR